MANPETSQSQKTAPTSFPFTGLWEEHLKRVESYWKELETIEQKNLEQARMMIDEGAKLMKAGLDYSMKVSAELRKIALDATQRATPKA
ncbi:MAG: hypothetical protein U1E65_10310 [Myxococcota bacterium]